MTQWHLTYQARAEMKLQPIDDKPKIPVLILFADEIRHELRDVTTHMDRAADYVRNELAEVKKDLEKIKLSLKHINVERKKESCKTKCLELYYSHLDLSHLRYITLPLLIPAYFGPQAHLLFSRCFGFQFPVQYSSQFPIHCRIMSQNSMYKHAKAKKYKGSYLLKYKCDKIKRAKIFFKNCFRFLFVHYKNKMVSYLKNNTLLNFTSLSKNYGKCEGLFKFHLPNYDFIQLSNKCQKNDVVNAIEMFCPNRDAILKKLTMNCRIDRKVNIINALKSFCVDNSEILKRLNSMQSSLNGSSKKCDLNNHNNTIINENMVEIFHTSNDVSFGSVSGISGIESNYSNCSRLDRSTIPLYAIPQNFKDHHNVENLKEGNEATNLEIDINLNVSKKKKKPESIKCDEKDNNVKFNNAVKNKKSGDAFNNLIKAILKSPLFQMTDVKVTKQITNMMKGCFPLLPKIKLTKSKKKSVTVANRYYNFNMCNNNEYSKCLIVNFRESSANNKMLTNDLENTVELPEICNNADINLSTNMDHCALWQLNMGPHKNLMCQYVDFITIKYNYKRSFAHSLHTFLDITLLFKTNSFQSTNVPDDILFDDRFKSLFNEYLIPECNSLESCSNHKQYALNVNKNIAQATKCDRYMMYLCSKLIQKYICAGSINKNNFTAEFGGSVFLFANLNVARKLCCLEYSLLEDLDDLLL